MSDDFDENRELCPDGNCLGVVVDGRCNVCGLAADGSGARTAMNDRSVTVDGAAGEAPREAAADGGDELDDDRQLCPDGACTGLIGSDGKCKECGRSAAS